MSVAECGMKTIDNDHGFGYSGGTWPTIIKCFQRDGMDRPLEGWRTWARKHPYTVNQRLAKHFKRFIDASDESDAIKTWHRGRWWKTNRQSAEDADKYLDDVDVILAYYYGVKVEVLATWK